MKPLSAAEVSRFGYELEPAWLQLPEGWALGQTGVATDAADNVYLFNRGHHPLIVVDRDGSYLRSWGEGALPDAHGMFIDGAGHLFLPIRLSHVVVKYDAAGNLLMTLGDWDQPSDTGFEGSFRRPLREAAGPFNRPTDAAVSTTGDIYISDGYGNARIHVFSKTGDLIGGWGEPGTSGAGRFWLPHAVWVHTDGQVYVADRENNRIQIFDPDGTFLKEWPGFHRPSDIYIDREGLVYVAELDGLVSIVSSEGDVLARWDSPTPQGPEKGGHQIWVDSRGDIYIGQNQRDHRILKYRRVEGALQG